MQDENLQSVEQCRDGYRKLLKYLLVGSMTAVGLAIVLVLQLLARSEPKYYATTTTGRVIPVHSLSEPIVTTNYILEWASLATRNVLNLHFDSYQDELQQSSGFFTQAGWQSFNSALNASGMIQTITQDKLDASAVVNGDPVILDREVIHGRYTWCIQLPILVTYTSASESQQAKFIVTMNVERISTLDNNKGIAISDIEVKRLYVGEAS